MVGAAAVLRYLQDWVDMSDDITTVPVELMDVGDDRVIAVRHLTPARS
jgi:hypothetical protein